MDLLERYLQAIRKYLPWTLSRARQQDILAELRANYESQLEERESDLGRKLTEGEMIDWLKQLGSPIHVAARYQPTQYLIGPVLFPMYLYVLRLVVFWSFIAYAFVNAVLLWTAVPNTGSIDEIIVRAFGVPFTAAAWVTLIFAILEYIKSSYPHLMPELDGISTSWSPTKLPPLDPAGKRGNKQPIYAKAAAEVIFGWLFLFWLLLVPRHPFLMFGPGAVYLHTGPFALAPIWWTFYWVVLALNFGQVLWNTMDLLSGAWRKPLPFKHLVFKVCGLISIGVLLSAPNHIFAMLKNLAASDAAKYSAMLNQINPWLYLAMQVVFLIAAIQFAWDLFLWIGGFRRRA
jgi:hypothetical protein